MIKIVSVAFFIFLVISNIGCDYDDGITETITRMPAEATGIQICAVDPELPIFKDSYLFNEVRHSELYSVFAFIEGTFGGCDSHHETRLPYDREFGPEIPIWRHRDTIEIEVMMVKVEGAFCPEVINPHREVVFVGFCLPGRYTLKVNYTQKQFTVGKW